jgi:uncharacterized protein YyaL (SSP411 family)
MLSALDFHLAPPREVAIVGDSGAPETRAMLDLLAAGFHPGTVLAFAEPGADAKAAAAVVPLLEGREGELEKPTAWVCRDMTCQLPAFTATELEAQLAAPGALSAGPEAQ